MTSTSQREPEVWRGGAALAGLDRLWGDCRLAAAVAALPDAALEPEPIAAAMVAEENLPMYVNSCRPADDGQRGQLAARTVAVWQELQAR